MGALVLKAAPGSLCITPQHQALAKKLHRSGNLGVQILQEGHRIPLALPVVQASISWMLRHLGKEKRRILLS